jgi:AraC-like DNA-binding protein
MGVRFGAWSTLLLVLALQAVTLAALLARAPNNRRANIFMACLLLVLAGMLTPFIIGYAGFYDAWPWLSFAPFSNPLAVGPLLFAHLLALATGDRLHPRHFIPGAAHFLYQGVCFLQPVATKDWIFEAIQQPYVSPLTDVAVLLSMSAYAVASLRLVERYRRAAGSSAAAQARLGRLRRLLAALLLLLCARAGFEVWDRLVAPVDYFDLFGFYVLLALIAVALGVEAWRGAGAPFAPLPKERDWAAQGVAWRETLIHEQWWRDPDLDAAALARRLGTNSSHLSRALNAQGSGFADIIGQLRAEEVARRLDAGDEGDLLAIALESGFGSKASFNRAFRAHYGMSPSAYRRGSSAKYSVAADQ